MNSVGGYDIEDIKPGLSVSAGRTITDADIVMFSGVSGDVNAVHLNEEYAKTTAFGGRIAHGMLTAGHISAVIANKLPGPGTIYLGQTLRFKAPVRPGDTVITTITVREIIPEKKRAILDTVCTVGGKVVVEGEATVMTTSSKA